MHNIRKYVRVTPQEVRLGHTHQYLDHPFVLRNQTLVCLREKSGGSGDPSVCVWCLFPGFKWKCINCVLLYGSTRLPRLLRTVVNDQINCLPSSPNAFVRVTRPSQRESGCARLTRFLTKRYSSPSRFRSYVKGLALITST